MFRTERQGTVEVVICGAPLNRENVAAFNSTVTSCLSGQPKLVLDLGNVALLDGEGLETLLDLQDELELLGGMVKIAAVGNVCEDALKVTGIGDRFESFDTVKAAVGSFSR